MLRREARLIDEAQIPRKQASGERRPAAISAWLQRLGPYDIPAAQRPGRAARSARPVGGWCNGNTAVFGTVILGSSPSPPAKLLDDAESWTAPQIIGLRGHGTRRRQGPAATAWAGLTGR